ncbi:MAG: phytoene desaturase family protein, partial [Gaiellales bacterium]
MRPRPLQDAVVGGAGPNGLAAAIELARNGRSVAVLEGSDEPGGGARTRELTLPGFRHDVCSAVHPLAAASPFLSSLPLERHGLEWIDSPVLAAHPLNGDPPVALYRTLEGTIDSLGSDGERYRGLVERPLRTWPETAEVLFGPALRLHRNPLAAARIGVVAGRSAQALARDYGERGSALLAGVAAHSGTPLARPFTAGVALTLLLAGHRAGWPVVRGGSRALTSSLLSYLNELGGRVDTGRRISAWRDLPRARAVLFATSAWTMASVCAERLPARYRRALGRFRPGPGAFKVDYALSEPIPWTDRACREAGTVHVGGTFEEIADAEVAVARGAHPNRPFVLVTQPSLVDASRAPEGGHTAWAYCRLPTGSGVDMRSRIESQIERFAPGFS